MYSLAASDLRGKATDIDYGQMSTVICYKTPYIMNGKDIFVLSFAMGNDVSLRSVLGLLRLLAMGAGIDLVFGVLSCVELN